MIAARLRRAGGVLITGPRAVGKTTTALAFARSEVRLDQDRAALLAARTDPRLLLDGEFPRLLDEYQRVDGLWEAVRGRIDERRLRGAYLLTGSATPDPELRLHSGAGRIAVVAMRTMSFFERGLSSGVVSTEKLLQGQTPGATSDRISVPDALEAVATGGWPDQLDPAPRDALEAVRDYLEIVVHSDLEEATGVRRNPGGVIRLLCSYARIVATGSVLFYRDNKGLEVDAVVEVPDGRWIGVEVKLGASRVEAGAGSLLTLREKLAPEIRERCGALVVVGADTPTYRRDDGVLVTSIAALGP